MPRLLGFIASILAGLAIGLTLGWLVVPLRAPQAALADLRADYRLDAALMIAEAYQGDGDAELASARLDQLGGRSATSTAVQAYQLALQAGYPAEDLQRLEGLIRAVYDPGGALPTLSPTAAQAVTP